jgi:hypothetical protein
MIRAPSNAVTAAWPVVGTDDPASTAAIAAVATLNIIARRIGALHLISRITAL